jgi:hypothetical protein
VQNPELALGENIVELAYGLQVTPWMQIHPNVQYIGNPGAFFSSTSPMRGIWRPSRTHVLTTPDIYACCSNYPVRLRLAKSF